jgi:PAN domain/PAN-like domain
MSDDGGSIIIIFVFVCCIVSCAIALIVWSSGGSLSETLSLSTIRNAINSIKFTRAEQPNILQYNTTTGSFGYVKTPNAEAISGTDLGSVLTGKTHQDCDNLCHQTTGCFGFTLDGTNCQLKNNVSTIEYKPNTDNLYASRDIGGVLYEHFPYSRVEDGLTPASHTWTFTGSFVNAVSNCHTNKTICGGFTWDGNDTAVMYPQIYAIDGTAPTTGQAGVYTTLEKSPIYLAIPGKTYTDTPTNTITTVPQWALPQPFNPTSDADYFTNASAPNWPGSGWDAGPDGNSQKYDGLNYKNGLGSTARSNTLTVADLNGCMNACVANTWCQSFVYDNSVKSCYMRRDQVAWPSKKLDRPTQQVCVPGGYMTTDIPPQQVGCDCGVIGSLNGLGGSCNTNTIEPKSGISNSNKSSYVRKNPPLPEFCPQQCKNDVDCVLSWYDTGTGKCNMYEFTPTHGVEGSRDSKATTWLLQNFPGQ